MTTTATRTPDDVLADLRHALASMKDANDIPGLTPKQRAEHESRRIQLQQHLTHWPSWRLDKPRQRRAEVLADIDRLKRVESEIDEQIEAAGDWRRVPDARERDRAWERGQALLASKRVLRSGCEFFNGEPAMPAPLRAALTSTCAECGHTEFRWPGPISELERDLEKLNQEIAEAETVLAGHIASAEVLLVETP